MFKSYFFPDKLSPATAIADSLYLVKGNGVSLKPATALSVVHKTGMTVTVKAGRGLFRGYPFELDEDLDITVVATASPQTIYLGVRLVSDGGIVTRYSGGTDGAVVPLSSFDSETDMAFGVIHVAANATSLTVDDIDDLRFQAAYCGVIDNYEVSLAELATMYATRLAEIESESLPFVSLEAKTYTAEQKAQVLTNLGITDAPDVVDSLTSTSATDALSANQGKQLDNLKMSALELFWTNSSPTSDFAAQAISLSLTGYDAVLIEFYGTKSGTAGIQRKIFNNGETSYMPIPYTLFLLREVTVSNSGVTFGAGGRQSTYGNASITTNAGDVIPYKIYGIKHLYKV